MKYYKSVETQDERVFEKITNLYDFAKFCGIKQPYLHKVAKGDYVISEKQYRRIKNFAREYLKKKSQ